MGDILVAGAVETVFPYAITLVVFIGKPVNIRIVGNSLMKSSIKYRYLFYSRQQPFVGKDPFQIRRIMQWRNRAALPDLADHRIIDQYRLAEFLRAMYHSMAHGVNGIDFLQYRF